MRQHKLLIAFEIRLDSVTARVEARDKIEGNTPYLTALKVDVVRLKKEMS